MSHLPKDPMSTVARRSAILPQAFTAAGSPYTGIAIATEGYEDLVLTGVLGTISTTGTVTVKVETDDDSGFGSAEDITGATTAALTDDGGVVRIRVRASQAKKYVRAHIAVANDDMDAAAFIWELHGPKYDELADGDPNSSLSAQSGTKFDAAV